MISNTPSEDSIDSKISVLKSELDSVDKRLSILKASQSLLSMRIRLLGLNRFYKEERERLEVGFKEEMDKKRDLELKITSLEREKMIKEYESIILFLEKERKRAGDLLERIEKSKRDQIFLIEWANRLEGEILTSFKEGIGTGELGAEVDSNEAVDSGRGVIDLPNFDIAIKTSKADESILMEKPISVSISALAQNNLKSLTKNKELRKKIMDDALKAIEQLFESKSKKHRKIRKLAGHDTYRIRLVEQGLEIRIEFEWETTIRIIGIASRENSYKKRK